MSDQTKVRIRRLSLISQAEHEGYFAYLGFQDNGDLVVYCDDPEISREDIKFVLENAIKDIG